MYIETMLSKLLAVLRGGNQQNDSVDRSLSSEVVLHNQMENNDTSIVVEFEYTEEGPVPKNVTNIRFHPNVTEIEHGAFSYNKNLRGVVLKRRTEVDTRFFWLLYIIGKYHSPFNDIGCWRVCI